MNEVRMVCAQMLDGSEPPLRDADEILQIARRSNRRRGYRTATVVAATVALLTGSVIVGSGLFGVRPPPWPDAASVPAARAAASHGRMMAQEMLAAVPPEYAAVPETTFSGNDVVYPPVSQAGAPPRILAGAVVRVFSGPREGQLYAYLIHDGQPVPRGDLCAPSLDPAGRTGARCEVRHLGGIPIRIVTYTDPQRGQVIEATRFLREGRLTVGADQGVPSDLRRYLGTEIYQPGQSLPGLPVDADGIATLAADPAMLPAG